VVVFLFAAASCCEGDAAADGGDAWLPSGGVAVCAGTDSGAKNANASALANALRRKPMLPMVHLPEKTQIAINPAPLLARPCV